VQSYGGGLDRHACCTGRRFWSARPGSLGMALTRRILGRESSTCPLEGRPLAAGPGAKGRRSLVQFMGFARMRPIGCWVSICLRRVH